MLTDGGVTLTWTAILEVSMGWQWLVLLIFTSLTTYRLTRLVVKDDFPLVAIPRKWIVGEREHTWIRQPETPDGGYWQPENRHVGKWYYWIGELITCHWCASGWVALTVTTAVALSNKEGSLVEWFLLWVAQWALGSIAADKVG